MKRLHRIKRMPPWLLPVVTAIALVLFAAAILRIFSDSRAATARNHTALVALCALRGDLDQRAKDEAHALHATKDFLAHHPHGIPGIPAALLRAQILEQQATLTNTRHTRQTLNVLACKES